MIRSILAQLKKDKVQRVIYGLALIYWAIVWIDDLELFFLDSFLGVESYWVMIIPTLILLGQTFFNRIVLWRLSVLLVSIYSIWIVWHIVFLRILVDFHRDYVPGIIWDFKEVISLIMTFMTIFLVNWIFWKIKPVKNK